MLGAGLGRVFGQRVQGFLGLGEQGFLGVTLFYKRV